MSWVDRLQEVTGWREEPWEYDWSETESGLGTALPSGYKELCERFGPGFFSDRIQLLPDRGDEGILSGWQSELMMSQDDGGLSLLDPYTIFGYSGPRGLIQWSSTDWGVYHWLADADVNPDEWPILVTGERGPAGSWHRYDMSVPELIYKVLTDPEFEPFTIAGKGIPVEFYRFDPNAEDPEEEW